MAMKIDLNEFLGVEKADDPTAEVMTAKMTLDTLADVFMRMKDLGIRQKDLAEALGVTPAAVSKMLSNGSNPRFSTVAKVAEALGCDVVAPKLVPLESKIVDMSTSTLSSQRKAITAVYNSDGIESEYEDLCFDDNAGKVARTQGSATVEMPLCGLSFAGGIA